MTTLAYTMLVQLDLSGTAFGGAPTWTDVTRFVRLPDAVSITSWRQDRLSTISPSTMQIVFDNSDLPGDPTAPNAGRFTPGLAASPFYPHILPGVRGRVSITISGVTFVVGDGYALDWDAGYDAAGVFTTTVVSFTDILGWMGITQPLASMHVEQMLSDFPAGFWPLNDDPGSTSATNLVAGGSAATINNSKYGAGTLTFGSPTTLPGTPPAATFSSPDAGTSSRAARATFVIVPCVVPAGSGFTIEWWFNAAAPPAFTETLFSNATQAQGVVMAKIGTSGKVLTTISGTVSSAGPASTANLCDGKWHHCALVLASNQQTVSLFVDGTFDNSIAAPSPIGFPAVASPINLGVEAGAWTGVDYITWEPLNGSMMMFAIYAAPLTALQISTHYRAGATGFAGEATDIHVQRLLGYRPNTGSTIDVGNGTVGTHLTDGVTEQQALLDTAKAEGGLLFADAGQILFYARRRNYNPVVAATFDCERDLTTDLRTRVDLQQMLNDVTISRPAGASSRKTDQASKNTYGPRQLNDTVILNTDRDTSDAAGWAVASSKDVLPRTPSLVVDLLSATVAVAQATLALLPLKRVQVTNVPTSALPVDVLIQGRQITLTHDTFDVAFYTSRLPPVTLRADAAPSTYTKLDNGSKVPW